MDYGQCHGEPEPGRRADSPKLSRLDSIDAPDPCQPDEKGSKQRRMKPLLFKDQLNLRHVVFFQDDASKLANHGRRVLALRIRGGTFVLNRKAEGYSRSGGLLFGHQ
jgi:hypothetical protein